jgi:transcriptional antiterminator NusG
MESFWYLVKVLPGKERQLEEQFNTEIELGLLKGINRFVCPMEKYFKVIKNKRVIREKVVYTGYLYFETDHKLDEDELKNHSHLPNIMSILGDKRPVRLKDREIERVLNKKSDDNLTMEVQFGAGDPIKVVEGPFRTFEGEVMTVEGNRVDVDVKVFGRSTKISLTIDQIEKL